MLKTLLIALCLWCGSAFALQGIYTIAPPEGERVPIASLTKMMTAIVASEQDLDEVITITQDDRDTIKNTKSRLKYGTKYRRRELIQLILVASENRAALALGRSFPGGRGAFVEEMNSRAELYGMNATFTDPAGLAGTNKASPRAVYLLGEKFSENEYLRASSILPSVTLNKTRWNTTNALVLSGAPLAAQKTGFTREAGHCLFMRTELGTLIILGAKNRYQQSKQLLGNKL